MADQLCGYFYLVASGLKDECLFGLDKVKTSLSTIFENNVLRYANGTCGALNGMRPDGSMDTSSPQSEEVWTGVTYCLAATMIHEGMVEQGFATAQGMFETLWEKTGLQYQTPEAFMHHRRMFRSLGYMRPVAIWAMKLAWDSYAKIKAQQTA